MSLHIFKTFLKTIFISVTDASSLSIIQSVAIQNSNNKMINETSRTKEVGEVGFHPTVSGASRSGVDQE